LMEHDLSMNMVVASSIPESIQEAPFD
jgi:hypothetical protein